MNLRHPAPKAGALPDCATPRNRVSIILLKFAVVNPSLSNFFPGISKKIDSTGSLTSRKHSKPPVKPYIALQMNNRTLDWLAAMRVGCCSCLSFSVLRTLCSKSTHAKVDICVVLGHSGIYFPFKTCSSR